MIEDNTTIEVINKPGYVNYIHVEGVKYRVVDIAFYKGTYHILGMPADKVADVVHITVQKPARQLTNAVGKRD